MATHCSLPAWRIPRTEEPGRLQSMGPQRVRHDWSELTRTCACRNMQHEIYSLDRFSSVQYTVANYKHNAVQQFSYLELFHLEWLKPPNYWTATAHMPLLPDPVNHCLFSACTNLTILDASYMWNPEKAMAPHSSTLAWKIPWAEKPCRLQSMGSRRVGHDWATSLSLFTFMHWRRQWQPTPVFLPGESQGQGSLVGCHLWGRTESDTTEAT